MKKNTIVPVKKILSIIDSCQDEEQIERCRVLINNYIKSVKKNGVVNVNELTDRLNEQLLERQEALYLVKIFNKNV